MARVERHVHGRGGGGGSALRLGVRAAVQLAVERPVERVVADLARRRRGRLAVLLLQARCQPVAGGLLLLC